MADYVHGHHDSVLRSHRWRTVENSAAYLEPHLRAGADLLDVGCGPGTITADLARRVAPGRVVGIDAAADAVDAARATVGDAATIRVDDAYALDEPDGSFDIVHAHQVLQHLTRPVEALREWRRVLRPGGVVAARDADYAAMTWAPADPVLDHWLDLYHRLARSTGGEPDAGRFLLGWAQAAGFTDVTASASAWCFATAEDRAWWGNLWADRVQQSTFAERAIETGAATADDLAAIAAAWRRWSEQPDGWFAVLHGEILARP